MRLQLFKCIPDLKFGRGLIETAQPESHRSQNMGRMFRLQSHWMGAHLLRFNQVAVKFLKN